MSSQAIVRGALLALLFVGLLAAHERPEPESLRRDPTDIAFDAELSATDAAFLRRTAANVVETIDAQ